MTDDTLRKECEKKINELLTFIEAASHRKLTFQTVVNLNTGEQQSATTRMTDWLLAFARAQQAKGLGEAAGIARDRATRSRGNGELRQVYFLRKDEAEWIASKLDAQATAREQGV